MAGWEERAPDWMAWARTPGHDAYWTYRHAFFELLPAAPPAWRVLEVGCGEGRVARDLAARGHRVTALDASPTLVAAAAEADAASDYVLGDAMALPFDDAAFDLVVAYNVLMDVEDMPQAVTEASRVLAPAGHLCACVTHPLADAGQWATEEGETRFVLHRSYLRGGPFEATEERGGLRMTFDGFTHSMESYARVFEEAGLVIEAMREPAGAPPSGACQVR